MSFKEFLQEAKVNIQDLVDETKDMLDAISDYDYSLAKKLGVDDVFDLYAKSSFTKDDEKLIKKLNKAISKSYTELNRSGKLRGQ